MTEVEFLKVLAALKACAREDVTVLCGNAGCPYWDEDNCTGKMARDALELLKEQEPVEPTPGGYIYIGDSYWYTCPECNASIAKWDRYCRGCGRRLNWDVLEGGPANEKV